jgi:twitching motility protein PilT
MSSDPVTIASNRASSTASNIAPPAAEPTAPVGPRRIDEFLKEIITRNGSDLHFIAGDPPRIRQYGELHPLRPEPMTAQYVQEVLMEMMPRAAQQRLEEKHSADFAYIIPGISRFRVNVMRQLNGLGSVMRAIPSTALTLDQLNMPDAVRNLCKVNSGLILVTGKTGSGKSTTLAAMIDDINFRTKGHILTIEDPIEFVHQRKGCLISQRELGQHTTSFAEALHSGLREDPDVILVGELRDYETMSIAVTAAEMGILVMGTLHTNGAAPTVDRMVNAFPADKQPHVRAMLSTSLRGVVSQQLIPRAGKPGRVPALEIMVNTPAVANLVRQGKLDQLENVIQSGAAQGMRTMDTAIQELLDKAIITGKHAYQKAINKSRFEAVKDNN